MTVWQDEQPHENPSRDASLVGAAPRPRIDSLVDAKEPDDLDAGVSVTPASEAHAMPTALNPVAASINGSKPVQPVHQTVTRATNARVARSRNVGRLSIDLQKVIGAPPSVEPARRIRSALSQHPQNEKEQKARKKHRGCRVRLGHFVGLDQ